jgi:hypothetical protein
LDSELHRKGRGPWLAPSGVSPATAAVNPNVVNAQTVNPQSGPHWIIVDDNTGTPET